MAGIMNIRRAIIRAIRDIGITAPLIVENDGQQPPDEGIWLQLFYLPDSTASCGKQRTDSDFRDGIFQVSVFQQLNVGISEVMDAAEAIDTYFYHGRILTANGQSVQIDRVELEPAFRAGAYWHQPISVYYQAITPRT